MTEVGEKSILASSGSRLESLDAIRGFDMLWIMGLTAVVRGFLQLFPNGKETWLFHQMCHVEWHGLAFYDTIFPLFLFIAGISFPFSCAKQRERGVPAAAIHWRIVKRAVMLVLLGLVVNGALMFDQGNVRFASVLGKIGLAWMMAAFVYLHAGLRARLATIAVLLAGYWAVLRFCVNPLAPAGADPMSLEGNFMGYLDGFLTPGYLWEKNIFDPSGVPMSVVAVGTALLGMCAGDIVRVERWKPVRRVGILFVTGLVLLTAGWLVSCSVPFNKKLWTPSYTLFVGGYSFALFAALYWIIDVRGWRSWSFPLKVIGVNAIAIYMAQAIVRFNDVSRVFLGGVASWFPSPDFVIALGRLALAWGFLYFLYRKNTFLKV